MKQFFTKTALYTLVYLLMTFIMTDELSCAASLNEMCLNNVLGKYLVFLVVMFLYDKFVKPLLFKKQKIT